MTSQLPSYRGYRFPAEIISHAVWLYQGRSPHRLITDKLRSSSAAHRTVMPSVAHSTQQYENNRAEVSHQPTRQRERQMRRFKSAGHAQRFLSIHGLVLNLFRVGCHYSADRSRSLSVVEVEQSSEPRPA